MQPKIIATKVPGEPDIELVDFYEEFRWYYPECEMATKRWFVEHAQRDWTFLDVGANIGYYSVLFSRLAPEGRVFAVEADAASTQKLRNNLAHNAASNVTVLNYAAGKSSGLINDRVFNLWGSPPTQKPYEFRTLDDIVKEQNIERLDAIKIDVDSFDFDVVQGARDTLLRANPYVIVELNHALNMRQQSNAAAIEWMARLGYTEALVIDHENFVFKRGADLGRSAVEIKLRFAT